MVCAIQDVSFKERNHAMKKDNRTRDPLLQAYCSYTRICMWLFSEDGTLFDWYTRSDSCILKELIEDTLYEIWQVSRNRQYYAVPKDNELYISLRCFPFNPNTPVTAVLGPILITPCYTIFDMRQLSFSHGLSSEELESLVSQLHVLEYSRVDDSLQLLTSLLHVKSETPKYRNASAILNRVLEERGFDSDPSFVSGNRSPHTSYRDEIAVLRCVQAGDLNRLESTYRSLPETHYGPMSSNPFHQIFYGAIANTTLVTRFAIEGGLPEETAFSLSDRYIQKMERCRSVTDLMRINEEMAVDFTSRVADVRQRNCARYSPVVRNCIEHIHHNIHSDLSLKTLSETVGVSSKYLSALFRRETGQTLHSYIETLRIQEAKYLLKYSDYTLGQISHLLYFSSQSYFSSIFRKSTGETPKNFRNREKNS